MIKFDSSTIYNKLISKLQQDPDWKVIINNSAVSALLKASSETESELARYAEYLYKESKWNTAQNSSSILAMANMLGYQPHRKKSSTGKIYVSTDSRTHLVGSVGIDSETFKSIDAQHNALNWSMATSDLQITPNCDITDSNGVHYIASPKIFNKGLYYDTLEIMQGIRKSIFIDIHTIQNVATSSRLDPYLYIPVTITNCEDASNNLSKAYFRVYVAREVVNGTDISTSYTEYRIVDDLLLSQYSDKDVEVYNDLYSQELFYLKFNNDVQRGSILDISDNTSIIGIRIDYVETLGKDSNVTANFQTFTVNDVIDSNGSTTKLYGINLSPIVNGDDEETIADIKANAPKFYINNYTSGTREAYENVITNMTFSVDNIGVLKPKKVKVFRGDKVINGVNQPVTCISFLSDVLEDLTDVDESVYDDIEKTLNYSLSKLKSPQDILDFILPNYVSFAVGIKATISRTTSDDGSNAPSELETSIRTLINSNWGRSSNYLDFDRNFYPSKDISNEIHANFTTIKSVNYEVEAIKKLNWSNAKRIQPQTSDSDNAIHTVRVPFTFNDLFLGSKNTKGFKDYRTNAKYVIRFDFMYKNPNLMSTVGNYHTSLFIEEDRTKNSKASFYHYKDYDNVGVWNDIEENDNYAECHSDVCSHLSNSYQFRYLDKVYDDTDFADLISDNQRAYIPLIVDYTQSQGCISDYLVYFSTGDSVNYEHIGDGYIEMTFDSLYSILAVFAMYDTSLSELLSKTSLAYLKCGNSSIQTNAFDNFITACKRYIDIYVSMRPVDSDLQILDEDTDKGSVVLYIDTEDTTLSGENVSNLSNDKLPRMISVECSYEEV